MKKRIVLEFAKKDVNLHLKADVIRIKSNSKVKRFFNRKVDKKLNTGKIIDFFGLKKGDNIVSLDKIIAYIEI